MQRIILTIPVYVPALYNAQRVDKPLKIILDNWIIRLAKKNEEKLLQYSLLSGNIGRGKKCTRIIKKNSG